MTDRLDTLEHVEVEPQVDGQDQEYWTDELEVAYDQVLDRANQSGFMNIWLEKKNCRQIDILRHSLCLNGKPGRKPLKAKKEEMLSDWDELLSYVLVQEFAKFKSKLAIIGLAHDVLSTETLEECKIREDDYDTLALCFAIYYHKPQLLRSILHLDKIHKTGFARMKMKGGPRRPKRSFAYYLTKETVVNILATFDQSKADGRTSRFKNILINEDHCLVFVRRCEKSSLILRGSEVIHGHRPEWIVLDFFDDAKRVSISSLSVSDSLEIACRIASDYFGKECEYENESKITYAKQLVRFLNQIKSGADEDLTWVELVVGNTPLLGAPSMTLTDRQSQSIGPAIAQFEQGTGDILSSLDNIESIKVFYSKKRVKLLLEKVEESDDEYVVRYSDHQLNPLERLSFEGLMRKKHGIPVLSTEKRFKKPKS